MSLTPFMAISTDAMKHILKKGKAIIITRHRSAGRYGYSGDKLEVICEKPGNTEEYELLHTEGIDIYLSKTITFENYEQVNVWLKTQYGILKKITARVTLYRRKVL
jgi:hypothetical protein